MFRNDDEFYGSKIMKMCCKVLSTLDERCFLEREAMAYKHSVSNFRYLLVMVMNTFNSALGAPILFPYAGMARLY